MTDNNVIRLGKTEIAARAIENATGKNEKEGTFKPSTMAVAFVEAAVKAA